ncbi:hypothetical protein HY382_02645 [Candidatus Curtissbacteria bacterium]|nr:hypothetical protein [Candidatus Curtissbacteria bacterium]
MHHHRRYFLKKEITAEDVVTKAFRVRFLPRHFILSMMFAALGLVVVVYLLFFTREISHNLSVKLGTTAQRQRDRLARIKKQKVPVIIPQQQPQVPLGWRSQEQYFSEKPSSKILEITMSVDKKVGQKIVLDSVKVKNGFSPKLQNEGDYKAELLRASNIISSTSFSIDAEILPAPPLNLETKQAEGRGPVIPDQFKTVLTLGLTEGADTLKITGPGVAITKKIAEAEKIDNKPNFNSINGEDYKKLRSGKQSSILNFISKLFKKANKDTWAAGEKLDITITSDDYSDQSAFDSDVQRILDYFIGLEPYKSRLSQITFHTYYNTTDLNCRFESYYGTGTELVCDNWRVFDALNNAGVPYDKVAVVVNTSQFGGTGGPWDGGIGTTYNGEFAPLVFSHEMGGHVIAWLNDEYWYGINNDLVDNKVDHNCVRGNQFPSEWGGLSGRYDFAKECGWVNWSKSSVNSIMRTTQAKYFNAVSQKLVNEKIDFFAGPFSENNPPVITITKPDADSVVSGNTQIAFNASDNIGVTFTQLYINGQLLLTNYEPFTNFFMLYSTDLPNAKHKIALKSFDGLGNSSMSEITVIANNPGRDLGDVNCDLAINSVDALMILRKVASLLVANTKCEGGGINEVAADTDRNGQINSVDALQVLRYTAGLPNTILPGFSYPNERPNVGVFLSAEQVDTDGDGLTDTQEGNYRCMSAKVNDSASDPDKDSISNVSVNLKMDNITEIILGSDPCRSDTDGDGFSDGAEFYTGTGLTAKCGENAWPADINNDKKVTITDITSFLAPVRRLDTSPGDANYSRRWDLVPGKGTFSKDVNVQDLTSITTVAPPMFGGQRAMNGPGCTP